MDIMFVLVLVFIGVVFVIVIGTIICVACMNVSEWQHNNDQPVLTVPATVKAKRSETSGGANNSSVSTWYYVTFELETGVRIEFMLGREYGLLAEGDRGTLTYQGTRYHGFKRGVG